MEEPGKYTAEPKTTEDFKLYISSLNELRYKLSKTLKVNSYYIVQSRKGPRLFEFLFSEEERKEYNVVTEHALPFLFNALSKEPEKVYNIYVIDDAIYFGTTIENLIAEINAYIKLYGLKTSEPPQVFAVIKSQDAKKIDGINIQANTNIRKGYSHFFVNLLMSDLMSLGNTMEVEFPIITYRFDRMINDKDFYSRFYNLYNESSTENSTIYKIPNYTSQSISDDETLRFSILFEDKNSLFSKIRCYAKENIVRFAVMMPYNLANNSSVLDCLFDSDDSLHDLWKSIVGIVNDKMLQIPYQGSIVRSRQRTLVILANYLFSLKLFFRECEKIEKALRRYSGGNDCRPVLDRTGLIYLLNDNQFVDEVLRIFDEYRNQPSKYLEKLYPSKSDPSTSQVFETPGYPGEEEKQRLQDFNSRMVFNSHNANEALSSLFFNQTVLVEQWYRSFDYTSNYRLKFGYNFQGLQKTLLTESRGGSVLIDGNLSQLHAWIDNRVDRGCIVPQYIIDHDRNHWDRVFRPGENEEALTSTLARFVSYVLLSVRRVSGERYVTEPILKKLLSVVYVKLPFSLSDVMQLYLSPTVNGLLFSDVFNADKRNVVDYLKDMFVLSSSGNTIDISRRFYNTEQTSNTTFSTFIDEEIENVLKSVCGEMKEKKTPLYRSHGICNKHLLSLYRSVEEGKTLKNCAIQTIGAIISIRDKKDKDADANTEEALFQFRKAYDLLKAYILPDDFSNTNSDNFISKYQSLYLQLDFYINLFSFVYFAPMTNSVPKYLSQMKERFDAIDTSFDFVEQINRVQQEYESYGSKETGFEMSDELIGQILINVQQIRDAV